MDEFYHAAKENLQGKRPLCWINPPCIFSNSRYMYELVAR